jgi:hypothetical protein
MTGSPRYRGYHDIGGLPGGPIAVQEFPFEDWQKLSEAIRGALETKYGVVSLDELRRGFESFGHDLYESLGFYERRAEALTRLLAEKDIVTLAEVHARMEKIAAIRDQLVDHEHKILHDGVKRSASFPPR